MPPSEVLSAAKRQKLPGRQEEDDPSCGMNFSATPFMQ